MTDQELRHLGLLQKRLGVKSRSELVRELVKRYEKLESDWNALSSCLRGYLEHPETGKTQAGPILKAAMGRQVFEDWS